MSLSLYALTCGHVEGEFGRLMEGGEGNITVPIPVFLIEHPKGRALFDTGLHPDCQYDPAGSLGERIANLFKIEFRAGEEVSARLEAMDRDPARIDLVINSHFHFDHVGGNALIPNATMVVQRREWDASMDPEIAVRHGFNPRDFDLGHKLRLIDGEHDVFGDGSVVCLPTHGHTPGHQSLRIRLDGGEIVLAADACYFCQTLRERRLPATSMIARLYWPRSTGSKRWKTAARASSSATTPNSGDRCRRPRRRSGEPQVMVLVTRAVAMAGGLPQSCQKPSKRRASIFVYRVVLPICLCPRYAARVRVSTPSLTSLKPHAWRNRCGWTSPKPILAAARLSVLKNPFAVNGAPRSETNTWRNPAGCSRRILRSARISTPLSG